MGITLSQLVLFVKQKQILCIKIIYKNGFYDRVYEFGSRPKIGNRYCINV